MATPNSYVPPASLSTIKTSPTTPQQSSEFAEAAHKARLDDYASYEAAERGVAKFLRDVVDDIWYNDLKDADTYYTKVTAIDIMALLDANSGGLHAVDMISLRTNMTQYYVQADGIPNSLS